MSTLPVILVSAKSEAAASHIISEIIDNEGVEEGQEAGAGRVWCIRNKYYSAEVRLVPVAAGSGALPLAPEGHLIYLTEDECVVETAARRLSAAEGEGGGVAVRVLACEAARLPPALAAWAARSRAEPVPLRAADAADADADAEPRGAAAVRAALHAHAWPGLRRADADAGADAGAEAAVERMEQWAGAAREVRALRGEARRRAAEALVGELARALGLGHAAL